MIPDLTSLHDKAKAMSDALRTAATHCGQMAEANDALVAEIEAALSAKPTLADVQALVAKVVAAGGS